MPFLINPGTESNSAATLVNAEKVADFIAEDIQIPRKQIIRDPPKDMLERGWFAFRIVNGNHAVEVDIPGDDPEITREGRPFKARRLYVDGSSWLYGYALGFIEKYLSGDAE